MDLHVGDSFTKAGCTATIARIIFGYGQDEIRFTITNNTTEVVTPHALPQSQFIAAWVKR